MKKHIQTLVLILIFIVGFAIVMYPFISNYVNMKYQVQAIADYSEKVTAYSSSEYEQMFEAAQDYNQQLAKCSNALAEPEQIEGYNDLLNIGDSGIMGYISIDKIRVELPIYHGTDEAILNVAAGHLQGTSIPIGGADTHSVISAHRGLPSAKLFTDLDQLEEGDTFSIHILNRKMNYEVDQIRIVEPTEIEELKVIPGKDYCTLITCTPYGINTHRLLVRGVRIEGQEAKPMIYVSSDAYTIDPLIVTPIVAAPILIILFIIVVRNVSKKKRG